MSLTITAYAKHRGVSRRAVYDAIQAGRIHREPDGTIEPEIADREWDENTALPDGRTIETVRAAGAVTFADARAETERWRAEKIRLQVEEKNGTLVSAADTERAWFAVLRAMRNRVQALPDALAGELVALARDAADVGAGEHGVRTRLAAEVHRALEAAAGDVDAMADLEGGVAAEEE